MAPSGGDTPLSRDEVVVGISVTSQCVKVPFGASGSSTRIAMLLAVRGTPDQDSGGEVSLPSHVYSAGIAPFALNADDVTVSDEALAAEDLVGVSAIALAGRPTRNSRERVEDRMQDRGATAVPLPGRRIPEGREVLAAKRHGSTACSPCTDSSGTCGARSHATVVIRQSR